MCTYIQVFVGQRIRNVEVFRCGYLLGGHFPWAVAEDGEARADVCRTVVCVHETAFLHGVRTGTQMVLIHFMN